MARVYPSWLPPNPREREALQQIRRRQLIVLVWLIALLPAGWIAALLTRSDNLFVPLTIFWIIAGITLAQRVTALPCPRCQRQFCAKQELPYWYGLFSHRCENCGLTLTPDRAEP